ncbi:MAG: CBS domain-containing protein [Phycisphaerae bacterium]|nr:CBS domain-containing protein [Phycisphaerae bacterium]
MALVQHVLDTKGNAVWTVSKDQTAHDAARLMHERHIGSVVVMNGDVILGIFTERDLMNRVVAEERDPKTTRVADVMTARIAICSRDTTLESCRSAMTRHKIRHLPVVEDGKLLGIISSGDILARELKDQEETIRYLHEYMLGPN